MTAETWHPDQYARFAAERKLPFDELVALCEPLGGGTVWDLGCGPGHLTVELAEKLGAGMAIGVDSSPEMLERAAAHASGPVRFTKGDLADFDHECRPDLVFANASMHWVPDHAGVIARWRGQLIPGGQLAIQVPCNHDHPIYRIAHETAVDVFADAGRDAPPLVTTNTLTPEEYARLLVELGAKAHHVAQRVYVHTLGSALDAVEWIRGTSLLRYQTALGDEQMYDEYLRRYRRAVSSELGDSSSYHFTFKRILMWARFE